MLSFNFFDSKEWEVVSNEAMKSVIKSNFDYISELEDKVKHLESRNKELIKLCDEEYDKNKGLEAENEKLLIQNRVRDGVISLSSELNSKIDHQRKEITHLLKAQEKLKVEIVNKEQIISSLEAKCNILSKKVRELNEGIHNSDDLSWKAKYDSLKKCVNIQCGVGNKTIDGYISELENKVAKLEEENTKSAETFDKIINLIREQE